MKKHWKFGLLCILLTFWSWAAALHAHTSPIPEWWGLFSGVTGVAAVFSFMSAMWALSEGEDG